MKAIHKKVIMEYTKYYKKLIVMSQYTLHDSRIHAHIICKRHKITVKNVNVFFKMTL